MSPASRPKTPDAFDLYELAVTNPAPIARFLASAHGGTPRLLREDFSGSGALCRGWVQSVPGGRAIAVDSQAAPLAKLRGVASVEPVKADVLACRVKADVIAATNFPLGYWHTRAELLIYLKHALSCLKPGGVFACDLYGGSDAFTPGSTHVKLRGPDGSKVRYTWEQRDADPLTARVLNAIHFELTPKTGKVVRFPDAFVYDWRLWSIPEMTDAMLDAGFSSVDVYDSLGDAIDQEGRLYVRPLEPGDGLDDPFVVYLVARKGVSGRRARSARGRS